MLKINIHKKYLFSLVLAFSLLAGMTGALPASAQDVLPPGADFPPPPEIPAPPPFPETVIPDLPSMEQLMQPVPLPEGMVAPDEGLRAAGPGGTVSFKGTGGATFNFPTITDAVNNFAANGGVGPIYLKAGPYIETVTINAVPNLTGLMRKSGGKAQVFGNIIVINQMSGFTVKNLTMTGTLVGSSVTGTFKVESSTFQGSPTDGVIIAGENGEIVLSKVVSQNNNGAGALLLNNAATSPFPVTVKDSQFLNNMTSNVLVLSKGNVVFKNVKGNGSVNGYGGFIDNTPGMGSVTILGKSSGNRSQFNSNKVAGFYVNTNGSLAMKFVSLDNNIQTGASGLSAQIDGTASFNTVGFNNNATYGANIAGQNSITLTKVKASGNLGVAGFYAITAPAGNVTATNSQFNANGIVGIYTTAAGNTLYKNVSGSNNGGYGAYAIGTTPSSTVTILGKSASSRSQFNGNTSGYGIQAVGQSGVTIKNVNANLNTIGVYVNQGLAGYLTALSNITANSNKAYGVALLSASDGVISNMKAVQNGIVTDASGLYLLTINRPVTVSKSSFLANGKEGIHADLGTGTLTLKKVKATGNNVFGGAPDPNVFLNPAATLVTVP